MFKNPYFWLVVVINLAILALTPLFPEGIQRMIPFTFCLVGDIVLWFISRKNESLNDKASRSPGTNVLAVPLLLVLLAFDKWLIVLCLLLVASVLWLSSRRKCRLPDAEDYPAFDSYGHE